MVCKFIEARYGISNVRLAKVRSLADCGPPGTEAGHHLKAISVDVDLRGEFDASYLTGSNESVIAQDTLKNLVYALASVHSLESIEDFAKELARQLLDRYAQVGVASISIVEERLMETQFSGQILPNVLLGGQAEKRTCKIDAMRGCVTVESGISSLSLLRIAGVCSQALVEEQRTTRPDYDDGIVEISINAQWVYKTDSADFNWTFERVRQLLIEVTAESESPSIQHSLYLIGQRILVACADIDEVKLVSPIRHHKAVDSTAVDVGRSGGVLVPSDDPAEFASAVLSRNIRPCMEPPSVASAAAGDASPR